ncbi:MAG: Hsp20/alpha crystallin family protein [Bacteroidales bacterium]|nr:Hsp20/alpha crystallin family protein [Bacteroidales bacterium]
MLPMISRFNDQNWFPTLFNDFFDDSDFWMTNRKRNVTAPAVNVLDEEKDYKVEVAAPGMTKDDFQIRIDNDNNLVISLEKKTETKEDDKKDAKKAGKYLRREFSYSHYQQAFTLPDNIDKEKITAKMEHGVLTIDIPKTEPQKPVDTSRQIEIQ